MRLDRWKYFLLLLVIPLLLGAEEGGKLGFSVNPIRSSDFSSLSSTIQAIGEERLGTASLAWIEGNLWELKQREGSLYIIRRGSEETEEIRISDIGIGASGVRTLGRGSDGAITAWVDPNGAVQVSTLPFQGGRPAPEGMRHLASFRPELDYEKLKLVENPALSGHLVAVIGSNADTSEVVLVDVNSGSLKGQLMTPGPVLAGMPVGRSHTLLVRESNGESSKSWLLQLDTQKLVSLSIYPELPAPVFASFLLNAGRESTSLAIIDSAGEAWVFRTEVKARVSSISPVDMTIVTVYLLLVLAIGFTCARRVTSGREVFLGGGRVPGWASGISIVLTNISAISFIALPSRAFATDATMLLFLFTPLVAAPIVIRFIIPALRKGAYMTAYEVLGANFGNGFRKLGSWFYCIYEMGRTGVLLVVPSIIISIMTGMSVSSAILLTALVTTIYTSFGGYEAVIWTDVIQGLIMIIALLATPIVIFLSLGSPSEAIYTAYEAGRFRLIDPSISLDQFGWLVLIFSLATSFQSYLWHQPTVQRILSGRDEKAMRTTIITAAISSPIMLTLMFFSGALLFSFYSKFPERMAIALDGRDEVFASFVMQEMPTGLAGLVIAAIFAASMSSLSSGINSIASVISGDLFSGKVREKLTESRWFGRWITLGAGILGSVIALVVLKANALSLFDVFMEFTYLIAGSLAGVFALALFGHRFRTPDAIVGFIGSIVVVAAAKMSGQISFMLFATLGIFACLLFAFIASLVIPRVRET